MRRLRRCCSCCCCWPQRESPSAAALDDATSLIGDGAPTPGRFYVPRRHSSFNTATRVGGPAWAVPRGGVTEGRSQSDSASSSEDEETPDHGRGRCWSTVPATSATDVAALVAPPQVAPVTERERAPYIANARGCGAEDGPRGLSFDKHILCEISEAEPGSEAEPADKSADAAEVYGYLTFDTDYDEAEQKLTVFLEGATELPKKGSLPPYGTYVKLSLTSPKKSFRLSRAVRNSVEPQYKEEVVFHHQVLASKGGTAPLLRLSVYECERQGRHDAVGHALLPLAGTTGRRHHHLPLTPSSLPVKGIGQLLTGLFYSSNESRLTIHVIRGRRLRTDPLCHRKYLRPLHKEALDTFVKVTLMCGGQKVKTSRSRVVPDCADPCYDHRSSFVVPPQFLLESSLVVTVVVRGLLGRTAPLGRLVAGPYTEAARPTHWGRMACETRSVVLWRDLAL